MNELVKVVKNEVVSQRETVDGEVVFNDKPVPTIYDVAYLAGVSIATVSRVINNIGNVRPATEWKVRSAIFKLGFVANQDAVQTARLRTA